MAIFANYDGIDGESKDAQHSGWIDVLSLDWGAQQPGAGSPGQSRRRGAVTLDDLTLVIDYEKAAPKLLESCLRGKIIPKLDIELTAMHEGAPTTYLTYELKHVLVTSYQVSAAGGVGSGPPMVSISNDFESIKVTYTEFDETGAAAGTAATEYPVQTGSSRSRR